MLKKITLLALSVGALAAFAAPAAQGQQLYELVGGKHVALAVKSEVRATSTDLVTTVTANGATLICPTFIIYGTVTENGSLSSGISTSSVTVLSCSFPITKLSVGPITIGPETTGLAHSATFQAEPCHFAGNIPFSYVHDTDVLTVTGADQLTGNCGPAQMAGSFTLETADGTPVFIE